MIFLIGRNGVGADQPVQEIVREARKVWCISGLCLPRERISRYLVASYMLEEVCIDHVACGMRIFDQASGAFKARRIELPGEYLGS